jgi:hypothetical protein
MMGDLCLSSFHSGESKTMWPLGSARIIALRPSRERRQPPRSVPGGVAATVFVAGVVLPFALAADPARVLRAGAAPQATSKGQDTAGSSVLAAESRAQLKKLRDEILSLGASALGASDSATRPADNAINQRITVLSASANYDNAKLTREVAEIAVVEYEEGIFKQDLATAMGELILAESDAKRAVGTIELAKTQLAEIRQVSKGSSTQDLAYEYMYEDRLAEAELREPKMRLALESAKGKLKSLQDYTRPKRLKGLKAEVEKARSNELATQAVWELEKSKLKKLEELAKGQARDSLEKRVLAILDRAVAVAEQLTTKLDQADKEREPGDSLRKELADLMNQLKALVEQAQAENAAAKWAKLKPRVHAAAIRYLGAPAK